MSSNDEDPTTINSLATELIIKIVRLSSPEASWDNATERSAHLRNLALVCRAFRGPAQEELFSHVVLRFPTASQLFVAVLKSRAGARFANTPRSLRAGVKYHWIDQYRWEIPYITEHCSRLEHMWLLNIDRLDVPAVTSGTGIQGLYCFGCQFVTPSHGRKLVEARALSRLSLSGCEDLINLDPLSFPHLKYLDAITYPDFEDIDLIPFVNSLGSQLSALGIDRIDNYNGSYVYIEPKVFSNLLALDIRIRLPDLARTLGSSPSHIRHLRVQDYSGPTSCEWAQDFIHLIHLNFEESNHPCLQKLERLRYPTDCRPQGADLQAQLEKLRPEVTLDFDEEHHPISKDSLDAKFNPTFWAFVDNAEAAEEARRTEGI
ncbi:hypothetical protein RQP46_005228 [Phenoliferia psychrophenolica]